MYPAEQVKFRTGIVILNYNGWRDTIECIKSLMQIPENVCIIVVDNASTDDSEERISRWFMEEIVFLNTTRPKSGKSHLRFTRTDKNGLIPAEESDTTDFLLIQSGRNGGYASGNNIGLRIAQSMGCNFFWLLNNDTVVTHDSLKWLLQRIKEDPRVGLCGSTLLYFDKPDIVQCLGGGHFNAWRGWSEALGAGQTKHHAVDPVKIEEKLSYVNGASTLVTMSFLEQIGLMDEGYFLYFEEIDWAFRAKSSFKLGFSKNSVVLHRVGATIGTKDEGAQSNVADYYMTRGQFRFAAKHSWRSFPGMYYQTLKKLVRAALARDETKLIVIIKAITFRPLN